jgi:CRP-like cAMP-binding protein
VATDNDYADLLIKVGLFAGLDRVHLAKLAALLEVVTIEEDETVCRQGDPGSALYIVARGQFGVFTGSLLESDQMRVGELSPGDFFGEMSLVTGDPRSATVRAERPGVALRLDRDSFLSIWTHEPAVSLAIARALSQRVNALNGSLRASTEALAHHVDRALGGLPPERRQMVLHAGVLEDTSPASLRAVFGDAAGVVTSDLAAIGADIGGGTGAVHRSLRDRLSEEHGPSALRGFATEAAAHLVAARQWHDALRILDQLGSRAAFQETMARALREAPIIEADHASHWIDRLSDGEAASDPDLALARAAHHMRRGRGDLARQVLRQGLDGPSKPQQGKGAERLTAELARLSSADAGQGGFGGALRHLIAHRWRPGRWMIPWLAFAGAVLCLGILGGESTQWRFLALLGGAVVILARPCRTSRLVWASSPRWSCWVSPAPPMRSPVLLRKNGCSCSRSFAWPMGSRARDFWYASASCSSEGSRRPCRGRP